MNQLNRDQIVNIITGKYIQASLHLQTDTRKQPHSPLSVYECKAGSITGIYPIEFVDEEAKTKSILTGFQFLNLCNTLTLHTQIL